MRTHCSSGPEDRQIIAVAHKHGCDLICMASHGRGGVSALVLGSETQKVLTYSATPVLVIR
jgi:nucleotide-binding universal stress UspA family protein